MTQKLKDMAAEIIRLQSELDQGIEYRRKTRGYDVQDRSVAFDHGIVHAHKMQRMGLAQFIRQAPLGMFLTAPVIYSLIVPLVLLDLWVSLFQAICFRAYKIPRVRRSDYIAFDRRHLAYLNWVEATNCAFCAYGNGLIGYVREISSRTEQFWCPIKHALRISDPHHRYYEFLEYGDAEGYRDRLEAFRGELRAEPAGPARPYKIT
ncbi:hypothetical protein [Blastomonas fulva]|jgi:hypothetical protein|uniref:hypothetical protein n=1 Tax=Blastomonas fulva TaxID=1550728 RepID=UPI003D265ED9